MTVQSPWCVIDANIILSAIRYRLSPDKTKDRDPAHHLITAYWNSAFVWVYSQDILEEYTYQFHKLRRTVQQSSDKRNFDTHTFQAVTVAIQQGPGLVTPTDLQNEAASDVIMDIGRQEHLRDPDDYPYLAAADQASQRDVEIQVIVGSEDSDLYQLRQYKGIRILRLAELLRHLG